MDQSFKSVNEKFLVYDHNDRWRYRYPEFDTTGIWAKVPPKQISDWLTEAFNPGK